MGFWVKKVNPDFFSHCGSRNLNKSNDSSSIFFFSKKIGTNDILQKKKKELNHGGPASAGSHVEPNKMGEASKPNTEFGLCFFFCKLLFFNFFLN
jgi:hypothetical protein